jgi:hypothetical protein
MMPYNFYIPINPEVNIVKILVYLHIDVGFLGGIQGVISSSHDDRDNLVFENFPEFFCDVVPTVGVLKTQVKFVVGFNHRHAV